MAAAEAKASRHAITPQLRPKSKVSLPVTSFPSRCPGETGRFNFGVFPAIAPSRPHRQNRQRPSRSAVTAKIGSLSLKGKYESRASEDVLCGVGQGRAVTACAGSALPLENKDVCARSDKSTLCDIKLAAGKGHGRPRHGEPRETPCRAIL